MLRMDRSQRVMMLLIILCAAAIAAGAAREAAAPPAPGPEPSASLELGRKVYRDACAECHGDGGRGDGPKAKKMGFRPRDLSLGAFKCRCTPSGAIPTDADLQRSVAQGLAGTPMVAFGDTLSAEEIAAVVQFIKTFSKRFAGETPPSCLRVPDPVASTAQTVGEGKQVYRLLQCWKCHGKAGRGDGPAARDLTDDWGQPIKPYNFTVLKKFKCGDGDRDFYRMLHTGMNGSPMPSFSEAFLFARDRVPNVAVFEGYFGKAETQELADYIGTQPDSAALAAMTEQARRQLMDRRTWALIHYLRSLLRPAR